jgi:uncharacterized protein
LAGAGVAALRRRYPLPRAAVLLVLPWALWHLPTFWIDSGLRGFPPLVLPGFVLGMATGAVVLGWLYERSRSSILVVAGFHATLNMASATEGAEGLSAAAVSIVVMVWAVAILGTERKGRERTSGPGPSTDRSMIVET